MSELYRARVDACAPPRVVLTVWQIHPDVDVPPESKTFALALVRGVVGRSVEAGRRPPPDCPLGAEIADDEWLDEGWMKQNAAAFVASVSRRNLRNADGVKQAEALLAGPGGDAAYQAFWEDLERLPQVVMELVATDAGWVQHLKPGLTWESAAYDIGAAVPAAPRRPAATKSTKTSTKKAATKSAKKAATKVASKPRRGRVRK